MRDDRAEVCALSIYLRSSVRVISRTGAGGGTQARIDRAWRSE